MPFRMRKQSCLLEIIRKKKYYKVALEIALETVCPVRMEEGSSDE